MVTRGQSHTTCATTFRGRLATAGRVPAMDAVCGLSIRGHWVGLVICNETGMVVCASVVPHGERFHVNAAPKHRFRGTHLSTLMGQGQFLLIIPAVQRFEQVPAKYESASERLWNWAGANKVPHSRVGG
jgi:hypothetical protein